MNLDNNTTRSQLAAIRKHLRRYRKIDVRTAREQYGCERLGARIWDLRHEGMEIITDYAECLNRYGHHVRYAVYRLRRVQR